MLFFVVAPNTIHKMKGYDREMTLLKDLNTCKQSEKQDSFTEKKLQSPTSFTVEKVCTLKSYPTLIRN